MQAQHDQPSTPNPQPLRATPTFNTLHPIAIWQVGKGRVMIDPGSMTKKQDMLSGGVCVSSVCSVHMCACVRVRALIIVCVRVCVCVHARLQAFRSVCVCVRSFAPLPCHSPTRLGLSPCSAPPANTKTKSCNKTRVCQFSGTLIRRP